MKLGEIHEFFIKEGIKADLRNRSSIQKQLQQEKKSFRKLPATDRKFFDKESFWNPYSDSRILNGDKAKNVRRILVGIDIEVGELLLADRLSQEGRPVDLVLAHHPEGIALAGLDEVMHLQTDLLCKLGFDSSVANSLMGARIEEIARRLHSGNHSRTIDAARLLNIPIMSCHTPADNHVAGYLQKLMNKKKPKSLQAVVKLLMQEPEYQDASYVKAGPEILVGNANDKAGKIVVDMTGGTEGSKEIFGRMSQLGTDTLLCMHLSEDHYRKVKSEHMKVVNAGHIASDNLGMNLLLDKLEKKGRFDIMCCSGFRRFKR